MRAAAYLDRGLQAVCVLLLVGLAVMVLVAVFMRALGRSPLWYDEVAAIWLVWLTFFSASLVTLRRAHLGFDGALALMPLAARRCCFVAAEAAALGFHAVVLVYGWRVLEIIAGESLISLPWLDYQVVQAVIPVCALLMLVGQALSAPGAWRRLERM